MKNKFLALAAISLFVTGAVHAQQTLGGTGSASQLPSSNGTSAGSPQTAGPMNAAPNGAGGTYGNPNFSGDPNTANAGAAGANMPQNYGRPYYNYGSGTTSGTTTAVNPSGAPFVTPPGASPSSGSPATNNGTLGQ